MTRQESVYYNRKVMPELPEVETIVRALASALKGLEVSSIAVLSPHVLMDGDSSLIEELAGQKILNVRRRGKMILIDCQQDTTLLFHLKMTGMFLLSPKDRTLDKHTHLILSFKGSRKELRFRDVRKFGFVSCLKTSEVSRVERIRSLGPEPLTIDLQAFRKLFRRRKARLKSLLLEQKFLAGIGNIYADEILFNAGFHPLTPASRLKDDDIARLHKAVRSVLLQAIAHKGSTIRDFKNAEGLEGSFQDHHQVYGREDLSCLVCGEKIARLRIGGRSSYFCPECQKP